MLFHLSIFSKTHALASINYVIYNINKIHEKITQPVESSRILLNMQCQSLRSCVSQKIGQIFACRPEDFFRNHTSDLYRLIRSIPYIFMLHTHVCFCDHIAEIAQVLKDF